MNKAFLPVLLAVLSLFSLSLVFLAPPVLAQGALGNLQRAVLLNDKMQEFQQGVAINETEGKGNNASLTNLFGDNFSLYLVNGLVGGGGTGNQGLTQLFTQSIVAMYENPAADTKTYVADVFRSAHIATPAYAQGFGFAALSPILEAWKQFRNLAYLFFVVIFIVIGFMIMLRRRVGQNAVTAQQAIPQVIIALVAVTFSYAIAGLLLDLMYVVMFTLIGLFGKTDQVSFFMGQNVFSFGWHLVTSSFGSAKDAVSDFVDSLINIPIVNSFGLDFISGVTAGMVVAIAVAVAVFGIFFELLKTYVTIIMQIILAPIALMMGAIPGRSAFGPWIRGLIGNLAAFPTLLLILLIYDMLTGGFGGQAYRAKSGLNVANSNITATYKVAAQTGIDTSGRSDNLKMPYISSFNIAGATSFLLGLGLLLGAKEAITQAKKALGASDGGIIGSIVNAGLKKAWDKRKGPMAIATSGIGAGVGAAGGAATGLWTSARRGDNLGEMGRTVLRRSALGAAGGAVAAPVFTSGMPLKFLKNAGRTLWAEGSQLAAEESLGRSLDSVKRRGIVQRLDQRRQQVAGNAPGTNPANPAAGSGVNNPTGGYGP